MAFANFDRVRVKFGTDRGHYGTVVSVETDDPLYGTYIGVKLDCYPNPMGYTGDELEKVPTAKARALWHHTGSHGVFVPKETAICPECGGELIANAMQCDAITGQPTDVGIEIECLNELREGHQTHRWIQSDWKSARNAIIDWCGASKLSPNN